MRSHLDLAIQDRIDRGESPEQAADAARQEFGNVLLIKETVRDMWGWTPIEQFWQDLGYARRALWRAPAFTIAAVLTLSLGIGANTAMFSVVRAVVLRPLPFAEPDRLVAVNELDLRSATPRPVSVSWPDFFDWRAQTQTLEAMAGHHSANFTVTGLGPSRTCRGAVVSANLFSTLGVEPSLGRGFRDDEEARLGGRGHQRGVPPNSPGWSGQSGRHRAGRSTAGASRSSASRRQASSSR